MGPLEMKDLSSLGLNLLPISDICGAEMNTVDFIVRTGWEIPSHLLTTIQPRSTLSPEKILSSHFFPSSFFSPFVFLFLLSLCPTLSFFSSFLLLFLIHLLRYDSHTINCTYWSIHTLMNTSLQWGWWTYPSPPEGSSSPFVTQPPTLTHAPAIHLMFFSLMISLAFLDFIRMEHYTVHHFWSAFCHSV